MVRKANGQFGKGNPGGPGRKKREQEAEYLQTLESVATPEVWRRICEQAVEDALQGDSRARTWLSKYLMADPAMQVDLNVRDDESVNHATVNALHTELLNEPNYIKWLQEQELDDGSQDN